jgi:N-acyl homoserine lactone hydrolase
MRATQQHFLRRLSALWYSASCERGRRSVQCDDRTATGPPDRRRAEPRHEPLSIQFKGKNMPVVGRSLLMSLVALVFSLPFAAPAAHSAAPAGVRLYTLDCGTLEFKDMRSFSDTGEYDGQTARIAVPCFLIRHPKGILMWDAGLNPTFVQRSADGAGGIRATLDVPVEKQLQELKLSPADVTFLAFSHLHLDHTGNANLFTSATWILNRTELQWATQLTAGGPIDQSSFSGYKHVKTQLIDGDYDVFGDGTVRILKAPGHTPGHQVLLLTLPKAGKVLLAGDLYHLRRDRREKLIPQFNTDRAETLASFERIEKIVSNTKARLVIQHDPDDFKALPKFPAYLE